MDAGQHAPEKHRLPCYGISAALANVFKELARPAMAQCRWQRQLSPRKLWRHGWWFFFPVVLAVKTPVAFLALVLTGLASVLVRWRRIRGNTGLPALFAITILFVCMSSELTWVYATYSPFIPCLRCWAVRRFLSRSRIESGGVLAPLAMLLAGSVSSGFVAWLTRITSPGSIRSQAPIRNAFSLSPIWIGDRICTG